MDITLTFWERKQLFELLSAQSVARAPLSKIQAMLELRSTLDPNGIEDAEMDGEYDFEITEEQFNYLYSLATNEQIPWPINQQSANLFEKLEQLNKEE